MLRNLKNCKHPYLVPLQHYSQSAESVDYQSLDTIAQAFTCQVLKKSGNRNEEASEEKNWG